MFAPGFGATAWAVVDAKNSAEPASRAAIARVSAVVLLFLPADPRSEDPSAARIVLTRRSTAVRTHKGQVGFPGGRAEAGESTPVVTALRELEEEVGIPSADVMIHGLMAPHRSIDGSSVVPVVATAITPDDRIRPEKAEVADLHLIPWRRFAVGQESRFGFTLFGMRRESFLYAASPSLNVWGLTAGMLAAAGLRGAGAQSGL